MEAQWFHRNTPTRSLRHPTHLSVWAAPNGQAKAVFVQTRALVGQRWKRCRSPHAPTVTHPFIIASSRTSGHPTTAQFLICDNKARLLHFPAEICLCRCLKENNNFLKRVMFCYAFVSSQSPATAFIAGAGGINLHLFSRLPCCFHILCHFCFSSLPRFIQLVINGSVHAECVVNNAFIFALVWLYACASVSIPQSMQTSTHFSSGSRDEHYLSKSTKCTLALSYFRQLDYKQSCHV